MPGYKDSEIGPIPEDWELAPLGSRGSFRKGSGVRKDQANSGVIPCVRYGELYTDHHEVIREFRSWISEEVAATARPLRKGDVVFAASGETKGEIGKCAAFLDDVMAYAGGDTILFSPATGDSRFLGYALNQPVAARHKAAHGQGDAVVHISAKALQALVIPWPPAPEQRAIAEALADVDAAIEAMTKLLAKKRDLRTAAMQQLLTGKIRLGKYSATSSAKRQTSIGQLPSDWDLIALGELVEPGRGIRYGIVQPGNYDPTGRYMIRGQDYSRSKGWARPDALFRVSPAIEARYSNARVRQGDLIMTIVGYCGHVEMVPEWLDGANLTQTTARLSIGPRAVPAFVKAVLNSPIGENQVSNFLKGAAQPGLNCSDVEKFMVPLPSLDEQELIGNVLKDLDEDISASAERLTKTRAMKRAMMQSLLTGRVRLPLADVQQADKEPGHA